MPAIPFNVAILRPDTRSTNRALDAMFDLMATERDRLMKRLPW
jgi:hypothetical protein